MARWHGSMTRLDEGESALVSVPSSAPLPIHYRDETPLGTACSCPGSPCVVSAKDRGSTALRKPLLQTSFSSAHGQCPLSMFRPHQQPGP